MCILFLLIRFQFHKGTIKTVLLIQMLLLFLHFNSIKVRLKRMAAGIFYEYVQFQFHKGTIKTKSLSCLCESPCYFNSIKVRLKPVKSKAYTPEDSIGLRVQRYKKSSEKCRCLKIFFLRPYDNLPIYGGFNKSKSTFGGFAELKTTK